MAFYLYSSCKFSTPDKAFATSSQWAFRFQVEDAFGCSHVTNTSTPSDLVDTVQSVAMRLISRVGQVEVCSSMDE